MRQVCSKCRESNKKRVVEASTLLKYNDIRVSELPKKSFFEYRKIRDLKETAHKKLAYVQLTLSSDVKAVKV